MRAAEHYDDYAEWLSDERKPLEKPNPERFFLEIETKHRHLNIEPLEPVTDLTRGRNAGHYIAKYEHSLEKSIMKLSPDTEYLRGFFEAYNAYAKKTEAMKWSG